MSTILNPLYYAVSWVLVGFHTLLGFVFGKSTTATPQEILTSPHESLKWSLSIIGLVILIRVILIPLFVRQIKSQRAMQVLQPKMREIQKRYKDDRQKQSEEMMKLYKEHKTNPLSSCMPLLAQAPIFFSLFTVLNGIAKGHPHGLMRGDELKLAQTAKFFGASLSASFMNSHTALPKLVTVALIILMYVLPGILALTGVNFPVGVLIYWTVSNAWAFGQQMYVIKRNPTPGSPAYAELEKKRAAKSGQPLPEAIEPVVEEQKGQRAQPKAKPGKKGKRPPK